MTDMPTDHLASVPPHEQVTHEAHHKKQKRKRWLMILTVIFLALGLLWLIYWLIWGRFEEYTDDAYVGGNIIQVMSQVPGTVIEISTDDTKLVTQGQTLVKLDPADTEVALQRASAALAQTVRQTRQYYERAESAENIVILRGSDLMKAQLDVERRTGLVGERAISKEEMQHYTTAETVAQAQYHFALHDLQAALAVVENAYLYSNPMVERAKAAFKVAYLNRQRTLIVAPAAGYVAKRSVQVGQQIAMNTPLMAIVPLNDVWVDANFKESQLKHIRIGQPVTLYADAYGDVVYHGKVLGLSPGTGVSFALLPPQNATGNWIKIVQRLPVRIVLDANEIRKNPLLIGLSMRVTINTSHQDGARLATATPDKPLYSTTVYNDQLAAADVMINQILAANAPNTFLPHRQQDEETSIPQQPNTIQTPVSMFPSHQQINEVAHKSMPILIPALPKKMSSSTQTMIAPQIIKKTAAKHNHQLHVNSAKKKIALTSLKKSRYNKITHK